MLRPDERSRAVVERVRPEIDCGVFPAKRIVGESVVVEADIFTDGDDLVSGEILYRHAREANWRTLADETSWQ
jgi:starch synthase (maltosyl-transferring)